MLPMVLLLSWSRPQHFFLILLPWYSESVLYRGGTFVIIRDPGTENSRKAKRKENKTAICEILSAGPKFWVFMLPRGYWLRCDKVYLQYRRPGFDPWVGKLLWRREWLPTPVFLPGKFHGQNSMAGDSPWHRRELDMTEQLTLHCLINYIQTVRKKTCTDDFLFLKPNLFFPETDLPPVPTHAS